MKPLRLKLIFFGLLWFAIMFLPVRGSAQSNIQQTNNLESRVSNLEHRFPYHTDEGAALWLFEAFCALWAQNTGRNPWLWFFLGMLFSVITVLVLLKMNADDKTGKT